MTEVVNMDYNVGPWAIHWEWQKQAAETTTGQQPATTTPTTPTPTSTTTVAPTTPTETTTPTTKTPGTRPPARARPPRVGLGVKMVPGPNGPEIVVGSVSDDGPLAGLVEPGDVILNVDGTLVKNVRQVRSILSKKKPGDELFLQIRSGGEIQDVTVRVQEPQQ